MRHLVVISVASFGLPLLQRAATDLGGLRTPPRVAALLLVACILASILNARTGRGRRTPSTPQPPPAETPPAEAPAYEAPAYEAPALEAPSSGGTRAGV